MEKRVLIKRSDYDIYRFLVPLSSLRKSKFKSFLKDELEKWHPGFSARCCTDVRLYMKKWKILVKVIVMEKMSLADYRKRFPGKRLYLEEDPKTRVFGSFGWLKILVGVMLVFCGLWTVFAEEPSQIETNGMKVDFERQEMISVEKKELKDLFEAVEMNCGKITSMTLKDGKCFLGIEGCYPEKIVEKNTCVVSYVDGKPRFDLVTNYGASEKKDMVVNCHDGSDSGAFADDLRLIMKNYGTEILKESVFDRSVDFVIKVEGEKFSGLLSEVVRCCLTGHWIENSLSIESLDGFVQMKFGFVKGHWMEEKKSSFLNVLVEKCGLFKISERKKAETLRLEKKIDKSTVLNVPVAKRDIVGEIKTGKNTLRIFYKDSTGKLVSEEKKITG